MIAALSTVRSSREDDTAGPLNSCAVTSSSPGTRKQQDSRDPTQEVTPVHEEVQGLAVGVQVEREFEWSEWLCVGVFVCRGCCVSVIFLINKSQLFINYKINGCDLFSYTHIKLCSHMNLTIHIYIYIYIVKISM